MSGHIAESYRSDRIRVFDRLLARPRMHGQHEMNPHDLQNQIAATSFFCGMGGRHVKLMTECACRTQFGEGEVIFRQGDTANRFYLIERGIVQLEAALHSGERRVVAGTIGPDGGLGWSRLFEPYEWQFTARALTMTKAIFFYGTLLREHCETDPALGFELFKRMSAEMVRRLQSACNRLLAPSSGFFKVGGENARKSWRDPARTGAIHHDA